LLEADMRTLIAAATLALLAGSAHGQKASVGIPADSNMPRNELPADPRLNQYRKEVDQDYRAATQRIPERKSDVKDPWANMRGQPAAKSKRP
jgi:hypothetical protein